MPPPDDRPAPIQIHNCHTHVFTNDCVPDGFFPFGLLKLLRRKGPGRVASRVLRWMKRLDGSPHPEEREERDSDEEETDADAGDLPARSED